MKRLRESKLNTPEEYDRIYRERQDKGTDWQDIRRWEKLLRYYRGGSLADLGCLDSGIPELIENKSYWGFDVAVEAIVDMQSKYPRAKFLAQDIYKMPKWTYGAFDYAVLGEVLEHLEYPIDAIYQAHKILKPGGVLAISVPKEESHLGEVDGHRHLWSFNAQDLRVLTSQFSKVKIRTLRSQYFPRYKYAFPNLIAWATK